MLIHLRTDTRGDGLTCEVYVDPATDQPYAIVKFPGDPRWLPMHARTVGAKGQRKPVGIDPIPVPGQPNMIHAFDTRDEAYRCLLNLTLPA